MEKLKEIINQYGRWKPLEEYILRIETFKKSDFSISVENSKSLLECIAKEICKERGQLYSEEDSPAKLLKLAFGSIGVQPSGIGAQISGALSSIGQNIGVLRNEIGAISHGRTMEELERKKDLIDEVTKEFLIYSTDIIACFLIQYFEWKYPRMDESSHKDEVVYEDCEDFNDYLDETYGEFFIGALSYSASEIFFNVDSQAYITEYHNFSELKND